MKLQHLLIAAAVPFAFASCGEKTTTEKVNATADEAAAKAKEAVAESKDAAGAAADKAADADDKERRDLPIIILAIRSVSSSEYW